MNRDWWDEPRMGLGAVISGLVAAFLLALAAALLIWSALHSQSLP